MLRTLLGDHGERDTVLSIFNELIARNAELERRVERLSSRYKPTERVSQAQVTDPHARLLAADDELRAASGIDEGEADSADNLRTPAPRRQPRSPRPSAHHRRVDNPSSVPSAQRACPTCGGERRCIEPHVTEVIELGTGRDHRTPRRARATRVRDL
ncbi:MAG TPA: hypothetical protein VFP84_14630 [Kofleriaceae bacterium]|nr:hypothetical protein [Kofleriaceae bacterium]